MNYMKLIFCPSCHDVKGLVMQEWRTCMCKKSGGQYNEDGMTATLGGAARVFGVGNPFFDPLYVFLEDKGKQKMWTLFYGHQSGDCWWGEYEGDSQIFRIKSPEGPRLKIEIRPFSDVEQLVVILDKREFKVYATWYKGTIKDVLVPINPQVKPELNRWSKRKKREFIKKENQSK